MEKEKFVRAFQNARPLPVEDIEAARALEHSRSSRTSKVTYAGTIDNIITDTRSETKVRIYSPAGRGPFPAILYMHGGGFSLGSPETSDNVCRIISATAKAVLVSVDYGLAPEHKFPFALEECYRVARWMLDNDIPLNIRSDQLAIAGDSAGGNLAVGVCLLARQRKEFQPAYQLLLCPLLDYRTDHADKISKIAEIMLTTKNSRTFRDYYLNELSEINHPLVSPLLADDFSALPPATIVTAELDPLAAEAIAYGEKLSAAGVTVKHHHYAGLIHDFVLFVGPLKEAAEAAKTVGEDLAERFRSMD